MRQIIHIILINYYLQQGEQLDLKNQERKKVIYQLTNYSKSNVI